MKTDINNILYGLLLGMMMLSCSAIDDVVDEANNQQVAKQVDLIICVGNKASKPLQVSANTRSDDTFNGLEGLVVIPFHTKGKAVEPTDLPLIDIAGATEETSRVEAHNNYYVNHCYFMTGTDRVLVYGKSMPAHNDQSYNPKVHGQLSNLPSTRKNTADIQFCLTSIRNTSEVHSDAQALADYMTTIANTEGWSTTTDPTLKSYYLDFIRMGSEGTGLMSGAAANIKAFVVALRALLAGRGDDLSEAIIANIDKKTVRINETDYNIDNITYPRSIGLPDGAAIIRWTKKINEETGEETGEEEFSVRTTTTTLDNINGINRYTYPAELMFFADSPIRTSAEEVSKAVYENAPTNQLWSAFLNTYYNGSTDVRTDTKAVAVENPIQYGVAKLDLTLTGMNATLKDAKDEIVSNTSMTTLPLKGVIIGGQHTVGYNMKPQGEQTDVDGRFIYETTVDATNYATQGYKTSTLVLQSYDNEKVPVILEFENNIGHAFMGKDGIVYPGARFYLIGMIDPADGQGTGDCAGRVFTQDYTTTMSMSVVSLAKAYTCMPDLLAPRLEIGVQVVTKWVQATTTNVEL